MADIQISVIDQQNTQLALSAPDETQVNIAVPGVQGPIGATGTIAGAQDGTAAAPGIAFLADTNTGIYRPGADQLAISTGGTGRLFVDANGSVGIGSGADLANSNMHLVRGAGAAAYMAFTGNNNTITAAGLLVGQSGGGESRLFQYGNNPITFYTQSLERLRLTGDGRLGIGTLSPGSILDIKVNNSSTVIGGSASVVRVNNGSGVIGATSGVEFFHGNDTSSNTTRLAGVYGRYASFNASGLGGELVFATNTAGDSTIDQRMVINSSGNVGIGTTSPAQKLTVSDGFIQLESSTTSGADLRLNFKPGFSGTYGNQYIAGINGELRIASSTVGGSNAVTTFYGQNGQEAARIDSANRLLVGTISANTSGGILQLSSGITFPATQVASSDPNTLDDYEEGTFTPTVTGSTTAGTATYANQYGRYIKIGRLVQIELLLTWSSGTGAGNLVITGLPFTAANSTTYPALAFHYPNNLALTAGNVPTVYVNSATANINLYQYPTGGGAATAVPYDAAAEISICGTYTV